MAPKATKTALSKAPGSKLAQNLQRVSPGIYRNAAGQLTNSGGRPMPGQASRVPSPSVGAIEGAARGAGAAMGGGRGAMPQGGGMAQRIGAGMRPPMGGRGGVLEGIAQGAGAGLGASMGGNYLPGAPMGGRGAMQGQFNDLMQRFQGPKDPQTMQAEYEAFRQQEQALRGANMGAGFGGEAAGMAQQIGAGFGDMQGQASQAALSGAQGFGQGFGGGMGGQQPSLEQQARSRAEAIARGDMVTMDYNPQREEMVNQILQGMGRGPASLPQSMGQGFGMGMAAQQRPGTVSGLLQRGPAPRPNSFQNMMQGFGGKKPIPY